MNRQKDLKLKLQSYLEENSSYFRPRLKQWKSLDSLPTMNKSVMIQFFSSINTVGIHWDEALDLAVHSEKTRNFRPTIRGISVGLSSGTSGSRGVFLISEREIIEYSGKVLSMIFPLHSLLQRHRIALFLRSNSNIYSVSGGTLFRYHFFDMMLPMDKNLNDLEDFSPTLIMGPPSVLKQIAKALESKRLRIKPRQIYSVAEKLDEQDRIFLEKIFGLKVMQLYQATEGFLGATCQYGVIHLNEDSILIERDPIPHLPRAFRPIITDLKRYTQPFVRYRLDDILIERESPCRCGSPLLALERIEGRCDDVFYGTTPEGKWRMIFPDFVRREILSIEAVKDFRAIQLAPNQVSLQILCETKDRAKTTGQLEIKMKQLFSLQGAIEPTVSIQLELEELGLRKLRRVERRFSVEQDSEAERESCLH